MIEGEGEKARWELAGYTQEQFYGMCAAEMHGPFPLNECDASEPFVYCRKHGFFYVPFGYHQLAMTTLLGFDHGVAFARQVEEKLGLRLSDESSEHWLKHTPGACFRSSQGKRVQAWARGGLSRLELRVFGVPTYVSE